MKVVFENKDYVFDILKNPNPDPNTISAMHAIDQMRGSEAWRGVEIPNFTYRPYANLDAPSAILPDPMKVASLCFRRDGKFYFGVVQLILDKKAPLRGFSEVLGESFGSRYRWVSTTNDGRGYIYTNSGSEDRPVVSIDGGKTDSGAYIRGIWVGASGAATRELEKESFDDAFVDLGFVTNKYINACLDFCSQQRRRLGDILRGRRFSNPKDLTVVLSCF